MLGAHGWVERAYKIFSEACQLVQIQEKVPTEAFISENRLTFITTHPNIDFINPPKND